MSQEYDTPLRTPKLAVLMETTMAVTSPFLEYFQIQEEELPQCVNEVFRLDNRFHSSAKPIHSNDGTPRLG